MSGRLPRLGVVAVAYREPASVAACLQGLQRCLVPGVSLLVFDNTEDAALRDRMRAATPGGVEYLTEGRNLGYAGAAARVMPDLFAKGFDHVMIVNQDLRVLPGFFEAMLADAQAEGVGVVGARTVEADAPHRDVHVGCRLHRPWHRTSHAREDADDVYPEGAAFLVTRAAYDRVGAFDADYFLYFEEMDFVERVRRAGLRAVVSQARIIHPQGGRGVHWAYWTTRNRLRFVRKHGRSRDLLATLAYTLAVSIAGFAWLSRPGVLAGAWAALRGFGAALADVRRDGLWLREGR